MTREPGLAPVGRASSAAAMIRAMAQVHRYRVVLYGASNDKPDLKAKIELYAAPASGPASAAESVGKIKFHDGPLPPDTQEKGTIVMHLPHTMLGQVVELLRTESPIYFAYHEGRAVLGTGVEEIGTDDEHVPRLVRVVDPPAAPAGA